VAWLGLTSLFSFLAQALKLDECRVGLGWAGRWAGLG